ncbi:hypothetical protein Tco_1247993 [Tanacetum coccineum]
MHWTMFLNGHIHRDDTFEVLLHKVVVQSDSSLSIKYAGPVTSDSKPLFSFHWHFVEHVACKEENWDFESDNERFSFDACFGVNIDEVKKDDTGLKVDGSGGGGVWRGFIGGGVGRRRFDDDGRD